MRKKQLKALTEKRGRRERLTDAQLRSTRDYLVRLLESTWGDVGWGLHEIMNGQSTDAARALEAWAGAEHPHHVFRVLLRETESPATALDLDRMKRQLETLGHCVRETSEARLQCKHKLQEADDILAKISEKIKARRERVSEEEREQIERVRNRRCRDFVRADAEYETLNRQRLDLEQKLPDGQAYFARAEMVKFCRSRRYTLKPLDTANALAGLPFIGWRHSVNRCSKWQCDEGSHRYQIFQSIRRILNSRPSQTDLIRHVQENLRPKHTFESLAIAELRKNWHFLREALERVLDGSEVSREQRLFKATSEYFRLSLNPGPEVALIAESEALPPLTNSRDNR